MRYPNRGFTLIETIVVLAIVATLTAIMFPVFSSIKNYVKLGRSKSQMNQLQKSLLLYDADTSGEKHISLPKDIVGWKREHKLPDGLFHTGGSLVLPANPDSDIYTFTWPSTLSGSVGYEQTWSRYLELTSNNPVVIIDETYPGTSERGPFVQTNHYGIFWDGGIRKRVYKGIGQSIETHWR